VIDKLRYECTQLAGPVRRDGSDQSQLDRGGAQLRSQGIDDRLWPELCEPVRRHYEEFEMADGQLSQLILNDCIGELGH
jgi:hypothetical protein